LNFHKNTHFKFYKVAYTRYSGEEENVYNTLWHIYLRQHVQNFIRIGRVL